MLLSQSLNHTQGKFFNLPFRDIAYRALDYYSVARVILTTHTIKGQDARTAPVNIAQPLIANDGVIEQLGVDEISTALQPQFVMMLECWASKHPSAFAKYICDMNDESHHRYLEQVNNVRQCGADIVHFNHIASDLRPDAAPLLYCNVLSRCNNDHGTPPDQPAGLKKVTRTL